MITTNSTNPHIKHIISPIKRKSFNEWVEYIWNQRP